MYLFDSKNTHFLWSKIVDFFKRELLLYFLSNEKFPVLKIVFLLVSKGTNLIDTQ